MLILDTTLHFSLNDPLIVLQSNLDASRTDAAGATATRLGSKIHSHCLISKISEMLDAHLCQLLFCSDVELPSAAELNFGMVTSLHSLTAASVFKTRSCCWGGGGGTFGCCPPPCW